MNLDDYAGQSNVRLRVKLDSDAAVNADGVYIDDFNIVGFFDDTNHPHFIWPGPDKITTDEWVIPREFTVPVGTGDYIFTPEVIDNSGISEIKVIYSVDGGSEQESIPAVSSGPSGYYELSVPEQPAGSQVYFKIYMKDASEFHNEYITEEYMIRFGNFQYYQNGDEYVDYRDIIGTSEDASATHIAKRISMGPVETSKGHYRSDLVGITIENYISDDYPSDPMYIHIWANDNGQPGEDLIVPFYLETASTMDMKYEITYVDLRPYSSVLSGLEEDVFVGFESAGDATNILYEVKHVSGNQIMFERSWLGQEIGKGNIEWTHIPEHVYHISAVVAEYEYLDGPSAPVGFEQTSGWPDDYEFVWKANSDYEKVDYYNIYVGNFQNFDPVLPLDSVKTLDFVYKKEDVVINRSYYIKITAVDSLGFESEPSIEICFIYDSIDENIPISTELYGNYPNPFNPDTTIEFGLAKDSDVRLTVYDIGGRVVGKLIDRKMSAGRYKSVFNGAGCNSGVYLYRFEVDGKIIESKKMIMLK